MKKEIKNLKVAIFGHANATHLKEPTLKWVEKFGECLAKRNATLYTGGGGGIMLSARRGFVLNGGTAVSVIPEIDAINIEVPNNYLGKTIATGQGKLGRVHLLAQSVDIAFALGGGAGTLSEIIACYLLAKPVIVVDGLQRKDDPKMEKILHRIENEHYNNIIVQCGYLDGKNVNEVCPVRICPNTLSPDVILDIGFKVWEHLVEKNHRMVD